MDKQNDNPSILIYDGDCIICREWVDYWSYITGKNVIYQAYQDVASSYPDISLDEFEGAIQLIEPDGMRCSGAKASFKLYQNTPSYTLLIWLYEILPGFAFISEGFYGFFSRHRNFLSFITHLFWGKGFKPSNYHTTAWVFLRFLGLIYLSAFLSLYVQIAGLIGTEGILPLGAYLDFARSSLGNEAYFRLPMIFWFYLSDGFLELVCLAGAVISLFVIFNFMLRTSLVLLFFLYLSLVYAGQQFMSFQWDMLLLEAGFLAIFLNRGSHIVVWLYRWLIFRFMFLSGMVKLLSGDPTWWDKLTALNFHFETQPLPVPLAWYAHHGPENILMAVVAVTLVIELLVPFLIFTPRRFRILAAWCFILFQTCIILTGNYNFFNLLTIVLCLFLFDDTAIQKLIPYFLQNKLPEIKTSPANILATISMCLFASIVLYSSSEQLLFALQRDRTKEPSALTRLLAPLHAVNSYGPFAVMTTVRNEIEIEGSHDKQTWLAYEFKYKPGGLDKDLSWIIPHQPRLDWQMWFAALSSPERNIWFQNLMVRLLQNKKAVTDLFEINPFSEQAPASIRARLYEYHFTTPQEREETGNIWKRRLVNEYYPAVSLSN